jgi:hypothetical protein
MEAEQPPWVTLGDSRVWPNLERDFPGIYPVFKRLAGTMEKVFNRNIEFTNRCMAVYSTGRLACEDFVEIAFLAEHGYGFAALKLLRGIYERTVVGRYIASNPDEAERFHDYNVIDAQKFSNRASGVYGSDWNPRIDPDRQKEYEAARKEFKYEPCSQCGRPPQDSFTRLSLPAMARTIKSPDREVIRLRDGTEKEITPEDAYLICAAMPNAHIHASMWSFFQRLKKAGDGFIWNLDQGYQAEFALSSAHSNIPTVFEAQNDFFDLSLHQEIKDRKRDWHSIWKPGNSKPSRAKREQQANQTDDERTS